ncbi:MAG: hydroxyisourate hydrolase [Actinomycetota bacterium]|nr:hydroxyisourate hydrolase [Actinomycetota bacterium]MDQ2956416.1 hydroxyisourate hydrolase [Actinomycetota bacterium]
MDISSHVLDSSTGTPVPGLAVALCRRIDDEWPVVARERTDSTGRIRVFEPLDGNHRLGPGEYRLVFECGDYLPGPALYPQILITLRLDDDARRYHVPLILSPFGYSTYLGSAG